MRSVARQAINLGNEYDSVYDYSLDASPFMIYGLAITRIVLYFSSG